MTVEIERLEIQNARIQENVYLLQQDLDLLSRQLTEAKLKLDRASRQLAECKLRSEFPIGEDICAPRLKK